MIPVIIIHYGEIALKGNNRRFFEERLIENIKKALKDLPYKNVRRISGRILIYLEDNARENDFKKALGFVFGVANFSFAYEVKADLDIIEKSLEKILIDKLKTFNNNNGNASPVTFRITTKRSDKCISLTSDEISRKVGEYIFENVKYKNQGLKVDLHNPDINCHIEIVEGKALLHFEKIQSIGGLPAGINGKVASLISSGFDSPVASWQMMRRGAEIVYIHFHSYPRTSRASIDNVKNLIKILNKYQFNSTLHLVPFIEIQKEILTKAPMDYRIVLYRRMMFRIAEKIARENNARALATGESLGQVASQTLENIEVISEVVKMPIFRPLIGTDKIEIMDLAKKIGTYDISKLPYEDCCSLFVPRHPVTKARLSDVINIEKVFDIEKLSEAAMKKIEKEIFILDEKKKNKVY